MNKKTDINQTSPLDENLVLLKFASLACGEHNILAYCLQTPEGRQAIQMMSRAQDVLSLPKGTSEIVLNEKLELTKQVGIPLTWMAEMAMWSQQYQLLFKIKDYSNKNWNQWKREPLFPLIKLKKDSDDNDYEAIELRESEKNSLRSRPLVISHFTSDEKIVKLLLEEGEWDPSLFLRKPNQVKITEDSFFGMVIQEKNNAIANLIWKDGRIHSNPDLLLHALACIPQTVVKPNEDIWLCRLLEVVEPSQLYKSYAYTNYSDKKHPFNSVALSLIESCLFANPHRWPLLVEKLDLSQLSLDESKGLLEKILTHIKMDDASPAGHRIPHFMNMASTLFKATNPGESWNSFLLSNATHEPKNWVHWVDKNLADESFTLSLKEATEIILNQDPELVEWRKLKQTTSTNKKSNHLSSHRQQSPESQSALWHPSFISKWIKWVNIEDQAALISLCEKINDISRSKDLLQEQKMEHRHMLLSLTEPSRTRKPVSRI